MDILKNAGLILAIDMPWLMLVSPWAQKVIKGIQGSDLEMRLWPAIPVYLALGYLLSLAKTLQGAFLLGLCTYAVYDFTNLSTFKKYPLPFAVADSLWGGILMTIAFWVKGKLHF
jgi:hypothetical protein